MVGGLGTVLWHCPHTWTLRQFLVLVPSAPYSWRSRKQRQQLAKARTVELGDPDRDQRHGDSSVFVDSPHGLEPCIPSQGEHVSLACGPLCLTSAIPPPTKTSLFHPRTTCRPWLPTLPAYSTAAAGGSPAALDIGGTCQGLAGAGRPTGLPS